MLSIASRVKCNDLAADEGRVDTLFFKKRMKFGVFVCRIMLLHGSTLPVLTTKMKF